MVRHDAHVIVSHMLHNMLHLAWHVANLTRDHASDASDRLPRFVKLLLNSMSGTFVLRRLQGVNSDVATLCVAHIFNYCMLCVPEVACTVPHLPPVEGRWPDGCILRS